MNRRLADLLRRATVRTSGPWGTRREERVGVMAHYTGGTDASGLEWLLFDPRCQVSYNWLGLDDGTVVTVAPRDARAWHAGACRRSKWAPAYTDANSAWYGYAIAAEPGDVVTEAALAMFVQTTAALFRSHGWTAADVGARITDHATEAWPRGRKVDTGAVLPLTLLRERVAAALDRRAAA
jgi:N-acetyl-anhydromuramyl-L-alanine amidase AmpD